LLRLPSNCNYCAASCIRSGELWLLCVRWREILKLHGLTIVQVVAHFTFLLRIPDYKHMSAIYPTRILSGRLFRLLFIYPSLSADQQLECYCLPFEIDAAPSYDALSYVWGTPDPSTDECMYCNGEATATGFELARALRRLRLPTSTRIVWVDAICINQKDKEEKSYQVPLMGSIYSLARRVVVWLGPGDLVQVNEAAQCVRLIANACRQHDVDPNSIKRYRDLNLSIYSHLPYVLA
jgi:hypothetical protein